MKYEDINRKINSTENVFDGSCRYYIMKSSSLENLEISLKMGVWATTNHPTQRLINSFR